MTLQHDLQALGLPRGGAVMVHASMRAVGQRAEVLVEALLDQLGPAGTLLAYVDFELTEQVPKFDRLRSPAAFDYGVLAEVIRRWPGAQLSFNPGARMAALGAHAAWFTDDHPLIDGYGPGSPLWKLVEVGGEVLLLGSDPDQVTLLHYAEVLARIPNKRRVRHVYPTQDGPTLIAEEFDTASGVVAQMPDRYFARIIEQALDRGLARSGPVGGALAHRFSARALVALAVELLERDFGAPADVAP